MSPSIGSFSAEPHVYFTTIPGMDLNRKRVLVVDDHPGMLSSLRRALEVCGINGAHAVRNANEAVARLRNMRYDIVLVDFDLGPGPDGQQLLEYCRGQHLLAPAAVFIMVTAERGYDRVMCAAEAAPDDYLVKPFTEDTLRLRLVRALERSHTLAGVRDLQAKGRHDDLVRTCARLSAAEPRFSLELARMKGDALLALGRYTEARDVFDQVLQLRALPWARLGAAQAKAGMGAADEARIALTELLADAPEYLAAYDALSRLHDRCRNDDDAKAVLKMALEVSPNAVHRHKAVGKIALRANDLETAEAAFGTVVRKSRHAFVRVPEDHLTLSRIYMQRSKFSQALETVADAKKTFQDSAAVKTAACAVESMIHSKAENPREARRALDEALAAAKTDEVRLDAGSALELAHACYLQNREHEAADLVGQVVANHHEDDAVLAGVRRMFAELDRQEQGESLIERCVNDAVSINNEGVARAKNGDLDGAIALLEEAARTMPDNARIVMNAAHALIAHMQLHGVQQEQRTKVEAYLERVRGRNPAHPKYVQVAALYAELMAASPQAAAA
ncbi:MAG: response regulator [Burkholderiales bacterium]|nr:response regulator [Burkholderiales bacterium]